MYQNPTTDRIYRRVTKQENIVYAGQTKKSYTILTTKLVYIIAGTRRFPPMGKATVVEHNTICGTGIIPDSLSHKIDNNYIDNSILVKERAKDWLTRVVLNYLTQPFSASVICVVHMRENSLLRVPWSVIAKAEHSITGHTITLTLCQHHMDVKKLDIKN